MFLENSLKPYTHSGWGEVICGSMFSGKTKELIRGLKRAQFAKLKVETLVYYRHRKNINNSLVMLGESQEYEPLSRAVFYKTKQALKNTF